MDGAKRLIVNIVAWNSARYLPNLFASLDKQQTDEYSISVIDNASADGALAWLQESRPEVSVLRNFRNLGFARAHNQGIAMALRRFAGADLNRRYILILNPDIVLDPDCLAKIISFMDGHSEIAIAGPKLYQAIRLPGEDGDAGEIEQTNVLDSAGIRIGRNRVLSDRGAGQEDTGQYDREEPFGISGAAMVIRASAVADLRIGDEEVFDEMMFAYKEDGDLCWRARLLGMRIALIPEAHAWHHRAAKPSGRSGLFGLYQGQRARLGVINRYSRRNQLWTEWKNDDIQNRLRHLPWRLWRMILGFGACLIFPQHLLGVFEAWKGRPAIMAKRKALMARRKASVEDMREWFR